MAAALAVQDSMKIITRKIHAMRRLRRELAAHFAQHVEDGAEIGAISWILKQCEALNINEGVLYVIRANHARSRWHAMQRERH